MQILWQFNQINQQTRVRHIVDIDLCITNVLLGETLGQSWANIYGASWSSIIIGGWNITLNSNKFELDHYLYNFSEEDESSTVPLALF